MAILDDDQRTLLLGVVLGLAAAGLGKYVAPAFSGTGQPLFKALIKAGLKSYERSRETMAHASEMLDDLVAEARAELDRELEGSFPREVAAKATSTAAEARS